MEYGSYSRTVYNILDLFGTIGGILEIFMFVVELVMGPISEHAFLCSAISTFYIAKHTEEEKIFKSEDLKKKKKLASIQNVDNQESVQENPTWIIQNVGN